MTRREDDDSEISPNRQTSTFAQITGDEEEGYRGRIYSQTGQYGAQFALFAIEDRDRDTVWEELSNWVADAAMPVIWI